MMWGQIEHYLSQKPLPEPWQWDTRGGSVLKLLEPGDARIAFMVNRAPKQVMSVALQFTMPESFHSTHQLDFYVKQSLIDAKENQHGR